MCWLILLYFTASHAAIIAAGRYVIPAVPFLLVIASGAAQPLLPAPASFASHVQPSD